MIHHIHKQCVCSWTFVIHKELTYTRKQTNKQNKNTHTHLNSFANNIKLCLNLSRRSCSHGKQIGRKIKIDAHSLAITWVILRRRRKRRKKKVIQIYLYSNCYVFHRKIFIFYKLLQRQKHKTFKSFHLTTFRSKSL